MNFSFHNQFTCSPSFLAGFAEDTEKKDGFQTSKKAGFNVTASLELMGMIDEVKHHQNLSQESGTSS